MKRLIGFLAAAGLILGVAAPAQSDEISSGVLAITIGALPPLTIAQSPDPLTGVTVSSSTGGYTLTALQVLFADSIILPTQLFTGVPLISGLQVTASLAAGTLSDGGGQAGGFGGTQRINGASIVAVLGGLINLTVPLTVAGGGGVVQTGAASLMVTVTGDKWTTGAAVLTGITTETPGGAFINTVTVTGSDARTASHSGSLTLVTPLRILTNAAGNLPGFGTQTLTFVPEPGAMLLGFSAVAGMAAIAGLRKRNK